MIIYIVNISYCRYIFNASCCQIKENAYFCSFVLAPLTDSSNVYQDFPLSLSLLILHVMLMCQPLKRTAFSIWRGMKYKNFTLQITNEMFNNIFRWCDFNLGFIILILLFSISSVYIMWQPRLTLICTYANRHS